MAFAPDGRLFVCEQEGTLRVIKNGSLLPTPFLTVGVNSSGERGLLGVAFDPDFAQNRFVYIYYTATSPNIHNRVSRFTANGDVAAGGSETVLLNLNPLSSATNHNGGALHFGRDGKLYIAVGENANGTNSQTLANLLGKMLRINSDGSIPNDNPFFNTASGVNRAIWAMGLRNPFTFSFHPDSGRLIILDVGQDTFEEINEGVAGANYGWPTTEGPTTDPRFRAPIFFYRHGSGDDDGCAITGGAFYNPTVQLYPPSFNGSFFFADFCGGWIRRLDAPATGASVSRFARGINSPVDLQVGPDGALYYLARGDGAVFKIAFTDNSVPQITQQPVNRTVAAGQPATFSVSASGAQPLTFQWQRDRVNISGATSSAFTLASASASDSGARFRAIVSNNAGSVTSNEATLTVTGGGPTATITAPAAGTMYSGGQSFSFSGTGTNSSGGALPASSLTWQIDFHHDDHTHPFFPATSGITTGHFTIPTRGETSANVFFRVMLTVQDGVLSDTKFVDIRPRTSTISLATQPPGLRVTLDGQPMATPLSVVGVEGVIRALGVVSPQTAGALTFEFVSWSDGGAATHEIATPINGTTFTATYRSVASMIVFSDGFAAENGWVTNAAGTDTATTGSWRRGRPSPTSSNGVSLQLGNGADGTMNCLATGLAGGSAGANDIDGGVTSILSRAIPLPQSARLTLSFQSYFAHLGNSSTDDFFRVTIVGAGAPAVVFEERGSSAVVGAAWTPRSIDLTRFAGQTVRILVEAADLAGGSLVEAGLDSVSITRQ